MSVNINIKFIEVGGILVSVNPRKNYSYFLCTFDTIRNCKINLSVLCCKLVKGSRIIRLGICKVKSICIIIPVENLYSVNNSSNFLALDILVKFDLSGIKALQNFQTVNRGISYAVKGNIHNRLCCSGLRIIF